MTFKRLPKAEATAEASFEKSFSKQLKRNSQNLFEPPALVHPGTGGSVRLAGRYQGRMRDIYLRTPPGSLRKPQKDDRRTIVLISRAERNPSMGNLKPISMTKTEVLAFAKSLNYDLKSYQVDEVHRIIHTSHDVVCLDGARQNTGKSHVTIIACLILAIAGRVILYSIHRKEGARAMMKRFSGLTAKLKGSNLVLKESLSNGFEEIWFNSGGAIHFRARTDGMGVGLTVDVIIYDEAQLVGDRTFSDLNPTADASDYPVRVHLGTPPKDEEFNLAPNALFTSFFLTEDPRIIRNGIPGWYTPGLEYTWEDHGSKLKSWKHSATLKKQLAQGWTEAKTETQREAFFRDNLSMWKQREIFIQKEPILTPKDLKLMMSEQSTPGTTFFGGVGIIPESQVAYVSAFDGRQLKIVQEVELPNGSLDGLVDWIKENSRKFRLLRIPGNARGTALTQALSEKGLKAKLKTVALPELSSSVDRFLKNTGSGEWTVYDRDYVRVALGSFWLDFDKRSGSVVPKCGVPQDSALVLAVMMSSVDKRLTERARSINGDPADQPDAVTLAQAIASGHQAERPKARAYGW